MSWRYSAMASSTTTAPFGSYLWVKRGGGKQLGQPRLRLRAWPGGEEGRQERKAKRDQARKAAERGARRNIAEAAKSAAKAVGSPEWLADVMEKTGDAD